MNRDNITGRSLPIIGIEGKRFYRWVVVSFSHNNGQNYWNCICDCGKTGKVPASRLILGKSKSCGCLRKRKGMNRKHGLRGHPLYGIWSNMKGRCSNPNFDNYPDYGGRGISVCERWKESMVNFYNDMIEGYSKGLHLDRIDNDGNYCPENCRWLTPLRNQNNKRSNVYVTFDGRTHTPADWARHLLMKDNTIQNRIRRGKTGYEALFGDKKQNIPVQPNTTNGAQG